MSPRNADPRVDRSRSASAVLCALGDHQDCEDWLGGTDFPGAYNPPSSARRCGCGCHIDPWPFEHDG